MFLMSNVLSIVSMRTTKGLSFMLVPQHKLMPFVMYAMGMMNQNGSDMRLKRLGVGVRVVMALSNTLHNLCGGPSVAI